MKGQNMDATGRKNIESANLTVEELQTLADEIRHVILGDRGASMPDYVKAASKVKAKDLGYRKSRALKCESALISYFPDEVFSVLQKMEGVASRFSDDDDAFIRQNINKDYDWLASRLYASKQVISGHIRVKKMDRAPCIHEYTQAEEMFIRNNASKGHEWLSEKFAVSTSSMLNKMKRMGLIESDPNKCHTYTKKEEKYIREHISEGTASIASALGSSRFAIIKKVNRMGLKYALPKTRQKRNRQGNIRLTIKHGK